MAKVGAKVGVEVGVEVGAKVGVAVGANTFSDGQEFSVARPPILLKPTTSKGPK